MTIIETMAKAIWNAEHTAAGQWPPRDPRNESIALASTRAALRAIKPEDVSDEMCDAAWAVLASVVGVPPAVRSMNPALRRAIAAAIAAGAKQ